MDFLRRWPGQPIDFIAARDERAGSAIEMTASDHISPGVSIIIESEPDTIMRLFSEMVTGGCKGLYVTRRLPSEIKTRPDKGSVKYVWLSHREEQCGTDGAFAFGNAIDRFLEECEGGVVAVDGVDCLNSANGGKTFVEMLGAVSRKARKNQAYVLVQMPGGSVGDEWRERLVSAVGLPILARVANERLKTAP